MSEIRTEVEKLFYDAVKAAVLEHLEKSPHIADPAINESPAGRPIDWSRFTRRVQVPLSRAGWRSDRVGPQTVEDLLNLGREEVSMTRNLGAKGMEQVDAYMDEIGEGHRWGPRI